MERNEKTGDQLFRANSCVNLQNLTCGYMGIWWYLTAQHGHAFGARGTLLQSRFHLLLHRCYCEAALVQGGYI